MYRIHQIKLKIFEPKEKLPEKILKKINKKGAYIKEYKIIKESIDARDKQDIKLVYTVDFSLTSPKIKLKLEKAPENLYELPQKGEIKMKNSPVIAGFGPCGIFAALILSDMGYKPIVIERGKPIEERAEDVRLFWEEGILNEESNVQFGEGGAGTFSDGKLTTQIKDPRVRKVLDELAAAGGGEEITYKQKPHIGTDVLRGVVVNLRKKIIANGGEIRFNSKLTDIEIEDGKVKSIIINNQEKICTENLILAVGHSARDTIRILKDAGLEMVQKPFSIGVRIEHEQELIDRSQYGQVKGLPAAEYKLSHHCENGRGVYTFCMCPGGKVITASSQKGSVVTNGMSYNDRAEKYANSALLVDVKTTDFHSEDVLAGIEFQEKYERIAFEQGGNNYQPPKSTWKEFKEKTENGLKVRACLPAFAVEAIMEAMPHLGRKLSGFDMAESIMTAVETRSSAPVRIPRNEYMNSNIEGLYPCGEGAGYAGGIVSAAVDGIKAAEEIVKKVTL